MTLRILFLTPAFLPVATNGVSAHTRSLVEGLSRNVQVEVVNVPPTDRSAMAMAMYTARKVLPPASARYTRAIDLSRKTIARFDPDVIHADTLGLVPALRSMQARALRLASLNDSYSLFTEWWASEFPSISNRIRAAVAGVTEPRALRHVDLVHVVSETDARDLAGRAVACPINVVPLSVPRRSPAAASENEAFIAFHGSLGEEHGAVLTTLLKDFWPAFRSLHPSFEFRVAGKATSSALLRLMDQTPGVRYEGFVNDLPAMLCRAAFALVPIRKPNGQSTKALDYLSLGVPLIVSPEVAAGLPGLVDEQSCLIRRPSSFLDAAHHLATNAQFRKQIGLAGRDVALQYSERRMISTYLKSIYGVMQARRIRSRGGRSSVSNWQV